MKQTCATHPSRIGKTTASGILHATKNQGKTCFAVTGSASFRESKSPIADLGIRGKWNRFFFWPCFPANVTDVRFFDGTSAICSCFRATIGSGDFGNRAVARFGLRAVPSLRELFHKRSDGRHGRTGLERHLRIVLLIRADSSESCFFAASSASSAASACRERFAGVSCGQTRRRRRTVYMSG